LLKRYGTLEEILAAGLFPTHAGDLRLFRSIAKAADQARTWGLNQLADRLMRFEPEGPPGQ
jgi:hypothetical protein